MKKIRNIIGILGLITMIVWGRYLYIEYINLDNVSPVLQAEDDTLTVSIQASEEELMSDVSAIDAKDGDISGRILIEDIIKKEDGKENEFLITYVAFDNSNNAGYLTRTLIYEDYRMPHFVLTDPLRFAENQNISLLNYFGATDCLEGDISSFITLKDNSGILKESPRAGFYELTLSVTNSVGDTAELPVQIEIFVNDYEEQVYRPQLFLTEYITYVEQGTEFDEKDYLYYIKDGGNRAIDFIEDIDSRDNSKIHVSAIQTESNVDINKTGVYAVTYTYTSERTGYSCNTRLIVVVE